MVPKGGDCRESNCLMEVIILAGGLGTRLQNAVPDLPKPLAPIGGRPFLSWLLDYLEKQGVSHAILSVGYRHKDIVKHFGCRYGSISLSYAVEDMPLGTGGAVLNALKYLKEDLIFIVNGDTFLAMDYMAMLQHHEDTKAQITVAVRQVKDVSRYGRVVTQGTSLVSLEEKSPAGSGLINAGVYLLNRAIFSDKKFPESFSLERDFLPAQLDHECASFFVVPGYFIDIGVPDDYQRAQLELPAMLAHD